MIKALLKNEFKKFVRLNSMNARAKNKNKAKKGGVGAYIAVMAFIGVIFIAFMFTTFIVLAPMLYEAGVGWLCSTYAVIFALVFSVIGSVFMAQSQLYKAKDNELMLSLPIPSWQILFCRMLPLYAQNFYFCFVILLPAFIVSGIFGGVTVLSVIFFIIGIIIIPLLSLCVSCILGLVVALISSRLKHSNIVSVIISLLFFGLYFYLYFSFSQVMDSLIANSEQIALNFKRYAYPLYAVGAMFNGDWLGFLVTFAICVIPFALTYLVLSKTYIGIVTRRDRPSRNVYKEKKLKSTSVWGTLIGKESKLFFRSTAYLLNCGLGVVLLFCATVFVAIGGKGLLQQMETALAQTGVGVEVILEMLPVMLIAIICMISSMDAITAPSISLEGKKLYILQSLPLPLWKPLFAKVFFHVIFNTPMAIIAGVVCSIILKPSVIAIIAFILTPVSANFLFASLGLIFNLKKPMLDWQNETVVIKQSISVLFTLLVVFAVFGAYIGIGLSFVAVRIMPAEIFLLIALVLISAGAVGAMAWLKKRGANILAEL